MTDVDDKTFGLAQSDPPLNGSAIGSKTDPHFALRLQPLGSRPARRDRLPASCRPPSAPVARSRRSACRSCRPRRACRYEPMHSRTGRGGHRLDQDHRGPGANQVPRLRGRRMGLHLRPPPPIWRGCRSCWGCMNAPANCRRIGRWRIVEADLWDQAHLDLCGPARLTITAQGGEIAFGGLEASLEVEYARDSIGFQWTGEEGDEVDGEGTAELLRRRHDRDRVRVPKR